MDLKSTEMYRAALENGSSLAGSNLAARLLDIGMVDDAEKILRKVISDNPDGDYSERIHAILGRISTKKDSEDEKHEKLVKDGRIISNHNCESISAMSNTSFDWVGLWELDGRLVVEITKDGDTLKSSLRLSDKKAMDLTFDGNTAKIVKAAIGSAYESAYTSGVLYLVSNDKYKGYMQKDDQTYKEIVGTRIPDIAAYEKQRTTGLESLM